MVIDKLTNAGLYTGLSPRIKAAFDYLLQTDLDQLNDGKYPLEGDQLFALAMHYTSRPPEKGEWEAHRRYADLQYIVHGEERVGVALKGTLAEQPYDASRDCLILTGNYGDIVTVHAGEFIFLWPGEAHMPCLAVNKPGPIAKVVVKIACD